MNWRGASLSPPTLKSRGVERVDDSSLLALLTFYFADDVHAFLSSKSALADSADVTRGDTLQNMGNIKYSIPHLEKKISGDGIA